MIALACGYFNIISTAEYKRFTAAFLPAVLACPCPHCKVAGFLILWGFYTKTFQVIDRSDPDHTVPIKIQRIMCKSCHKTFSLLPDSVIPRCRFSVMDMYRILKDHFTGTHIIEELIDSISGRSIKRYANRFLQWKEHHGIDLDICVATCQEIRASFQKDTLPFLYVP